MTSSEKPPPGTDGAPASRMTGTPAFTSVPPRRQPALFPGVSVIEEVYRQARNHPHGGGPDAFIEVPVSPEIYFEILRERWSSGIPPEMKDVTIRVTAGFGDKDGVILLRGGMVRE